MTQFRPHSAHWGAFTAVVEDGRVVEARPFPGDPAPPALLAAIPDAVHSPVRIDRPHIRRGWLRGDRGGGTLRGAEPFVPVDWDTAIRLVAEEVARVRDTHGPASIFGGSYGWSSAGRFHHAKTQLQRLLACAGGYTGQVTNYSYATGMTLMPRIVGTNAPVEGPVPEWRDIVAHTKLMLCFGGITLRNGQITSGGGARHEMALHLRLAVEAGLRLVNISPVRSDMPDWARAEWIPIRPGTDVALMLAMAHVLFSEGLADTGFLQRCTTGHEPLRAYVLGQADGVAKTPAWAEAITAVPAATIAALARDCARAPSLLAAAWSLQRAERGEQPFWMLPALAAMLGGIGKPGQGFAFGYGSMGGMGITRERVPSVSLPAMTNPARSVIPVARLTEMLERPGGAYDYNGQARSYPDIRLIWWAGGNPFHHHQDLNRLLRAWARTETIIVSEPWWTSPARHADIVLPATTTLERDDIGSSSADRFVLAMKQAIAPQAQARNEFDYLADVADALGVRERFTGQRDVGAWLRALYATWSEGCARRGIEVPDFDSFWEQGHVEIPEPPRTDVPFAAFARDPVAAPLHTPSGRIEIYSETIAGFGYDDCPGHPVWLEPREWLGGVAAATWPLHLLTSQPATRLHGQLDQGRVAAADKIAGREPILMHPADAAARGLGEGDIVRVFNDRGACLAGLRLSDAPMPGVVVMATGAWFDPLEPGRPGSLCVHGNPNILTQDVGTSRLGQGPSAQSCLVEVERWQGPLPEVTVHRPPPIEAP
ncbi:Biotin sulfoxide reductase [Rhodovastum atsumiense]|uniref:Molybdopterin-dependent oxidoreductase n=1 Tax=Rhodovastum atsumiense TaxID=504468 RepID=A0A5M6J124_9PROT|nr:molybdopterin-dependent oxidoreductase [Rhodovastum atsumiense]KAA5614282.1 molybdopterin-dependent oxidoreductase [Rhodovastum atsumiense]CAH2604738.1 Biotin sulfoxide reductase [Rhodovastum atsumiense]